MKLYERKLSCDDRAWKCREGSHDAGLCYSYQEVDEPLYRIDPDAYLEDTSEYLTPPPNQRYDGFVVRVNGEDTP